MRTVLARFVSSRIFWPIVMLAVLFAMGTQSALFGPVKYSILPQHLKEEELVGGNALVEMGTFLAILAGTIGAGIMMASSSYAPIVAGSVVGVALLGYLASLGIPKASAAMPGLPLDWNIFRQSWAILKLGLGQRPAVSRSLVGNSWFWFLGAIYLTQIPAYAKEWLYGDESVVTLILTVFSLGIGLGSMLCERMSGHKVEIGLVPFGSIGLSVFGFDLFLASLSYVNTDLVGVQEFVAQKGSWRILFDCIFIGVFGGFYIVPLFALIQTRTEPAHLSRTIAGMNIMNALFMVTAALVAMLLLGMGLSIPQIFMATALMNAVVAIYIFLLVPEFLMRFCAWILIHTLHRVHTVDTDRIPETGPAVLVCNHVSYMDALVIAAASPRPIRFVMDHRIFGIPVVSWLFRAAKAIPIAPAREDAKLMAEAYDQIAAALDEGELVCIFPEGKLTRDGEIDAFRSGVQHIVARTPVPVIPMALRGLWGSLLTRGDGNPFERSFRRGPWSRLSLSVGEPLAPAQATPDTLRQQVMALRGDWK